MELFDTLNSSEETIAMLGDRWWPQAGIQGGDKICKRFEAPKCWRSRNGASFRKRCVVSAQMTRANNMRSARSHPPFTRTRGEKGGARKQVARLAHALVSGIDGGSTVKM